MRDGRATIRSVPFLASLILLAGPMARPQDPGEPSPESPKFDVAPAVSPNGRWLVVLVTELEESSPEPGLSFLRSAGRKLFRIALSAKRPRVSLLHETREPDLRTVVLSSTRYVENALILDDGTALAMMDGVRLARWNAAGKYSEHRVFPENPVSFRQLHLAAGGRKLVAHRRTFGMNRTFTSQLVDLKTHQVTEAPFLKGLLGAPLHWSADLKHVYGIEVQTAAVPVKAPANGEGAITIRRESYRLVRVSTRGAEKVLLAPDVREDAVRFGKNVIVWSARGKDGVETFASARKSDPPAVEPVPGLKTWAPVLSLEEDRFLLRSGKDRFGIVDFAGAGAEAAQRTPPVELLTLPPHEHIVYSPPLRSFVLSKDGVTWRLVDLKGAEVWQIQLAPGGGK